MLSTYNVIHAVISDRCMHFLVTVDLVCHGPEETRPVLDHVFYDVTLFAHDDFKLAIFFPPFLLGQLNTEVVVLVFAVIAALVFCVVDSLGLGDGTQTCRW